MKLTPPPQAPLPKKAILHMVQITYVVVRL